MQTKKVTEQKDTTPPAGPRPPQDDMQTAYQVHTLAQYLYGHYTPQPWTGSASLYASQRMEPAYWGPYATSAWTNPGWTTNPPGTYHALNPIHPFVFPR